MIRYFSLRGRDSRAGNDPEGLDFDESDSDDSLIFYDAMSLGPDEQNIISSRDANKKILVSSGEFLIPGDSVTLNCTLGFLQDKIDELIIIGDEFLDSGLDPSALSVFDDVKILVRMKQSVLQRAGNIISEFSNRGFKEFILEYHLPPDDCISDAISYGEFANQVKCIKSRFPSISISISNIPQCVRKVLSDSGERFLENIPSYAGSSYDIVVDKDIDICGLCEYFHSCDGFLSAPNIIIKTKARHIPIVPKEAKIELTYRCNLDCEFCYNKNAKNDIAKDTTPQNNPDLPASRIKDMISILKSKGIRIIRFTGGEPYMRKDLFDLIGYADSIGMETILNTNGTLVNVDEVLGSSLDTIVIPMHKYGDRSFFSKLDKISKMHLHKNVLVSTLINEQNIDDFERFNEAFSSLDIGWFFQKEIPLHKDSKATLDASRLKKLIDRVYDIAFTSGRRIFLLGIPLCFHSEDKMRLIGKGFNTCGIGDSVTIGPDGKVKYCYSIPEPGKDVFSSDFDINNLEFISDVKSGRFLDEKCKKCHLLRDCLGGCLFSPEFVRFVKDDSKTMNR